MDGGLYKEIENIIVGDRVVSSDGKTVNVVLDVIKRQSNTINLQTSLSAFEVTTEHPFLTDSGFKTVEELEKGDSIVIPLGKEKTSGLTDNELRWLGFWLGDGDVYKEKDTNYLVFRVTVSSKKEGFITGLNIGSSKRKHSSHESTVVHVLQHRKHRTLANILKLCFDSNKNKQLPLVFNKKEYQLILDGYLKADGYFCRKSYFEVNSVSKKLLYAIQIASLISGYNPTAIKLHERNDNDIFINGKKVKKVKPIYRMYIDLSKKEIKTSSDFIHRSGGGRKTVYNITVDGDNTYICNNHAVHNCAWFAEQVTRLQDGSNWVIGNTIGEKINMLNQHRARGNAFFRGEAQPEVGQSIVIKTNGRYGHVAVVNEILPDGRLKLTESNWNNDLRVTHDRIIDPNDQDIVGFLRTKPTSEFRQVASNTNPQTPTTPKTPRIDAPAPQDRQELSIEEQPVKIDDLKVNNPNARRLQETSRLDNNNLESIIKSNPPSNNFNEQVQSIQKLTQPKPTPNPTPTSLIKPFTFQQVSKPMSVKPQMSMATPIKKPPMMSQPVKQFKAPQMSVAPKPVRSVAMSMAQKPVPKVVSTPQRSTQQPNYKKQSPVKTVVSKIKGYFA